MEVAVQPQDVRVTEIRLDLDLAPYLLFHLALLELGFVQHFQRADEVRRAFFGQVDATEFAFAERFADLEHA